MLIQLVVACLVSWLLLQKWKRRHFEKLYQQLKISAPRLPLLGHLYMLICSEEERMKKFQSLGKEAMNSGGIAGLWIAHKLYIHVADSAVADIIMKTCLEKDDVIKCFHVATGNGSIFASVKSWRPRRKCVAPAFSLKNLNRYVEIFSKLSRLVVDKIGEEKLLGSDTISPAKVYLLYGMNAIFGSLGLEVDAHKNANHPFLLALEEVMTAVVARFFQPWLYKDFVYKSLPRYRRLALHKPVVFGLINKMIIEKRKQIEVFHDDLKKDGPRSDEMNSFINMMIAANVSDNVIREECIVMIAAASDTTSVSLGYITLMLARHPEMQEKVYQELKESIGEFERPIQPEALPHLKYLAAFIRETLRLYPPVPVIVRKIENNIELRAQYAMMSMKTVIATILQHYRIVPASENIKNEPLRVKYDLMMRHMDNYRVKFELRK